MGICRDSRHAKRRATGGKRFNDRKKASSSWGPPTNTKITSRRSPRSAPRRQQKVRVIESGNYSWARRSARARPCFDVVYNASNNEPRRTKTLVKNAIVQVDATPFRNGTRRTTASRSA